MPNLARLQQLDVDEGVDGHAAAARLLLDAANTEAELRRAEAQQLPGVPARAPGRCAGGELSHGQALELCVQGEGGKGEGKGRKIRGRMGGPGEENEGGKERFFEGSGQKGKTPKTKGRGLKN